LVRSTLESDCFLLGGAYSDARPAPRRVGIGCQKRGTHGIEERRVHDPEPAVIESVVKREQVISILVFAAFVVAVLVIYVTFSGMSVSTILNTVEK
jgi:hypothetical protein